MAQVGRRVLGDGLVWLGVPFRTQIDGGDFQYVNCGPASLTMVLAAFGLEVGPSQVRDYLNNLIDNYNTDLGTSLDVLSRIGREAGLTPMDLYSDRGGYRNWSTDAVRWHVAAGASGDHAGQVPQSARARPVAVRVRPLHRHQRPHAQRLHLQRRRVRHDARAMGSRSRTSSCSTPGRTRPSRTTPWRLGWPRMREGAVVPGAAAARGGAAAEVESTAARASRRLADAG